MAPPSAAHTRVIYDEREPGVMQEAETREERRHGPNRVHERRQSDRRRNGSEPERGMSDESKALALLEALERSRDREQQLRDEITHRQTDTVAKALEDISARLDAIEAEQEAAARRESRRVGAAVVIGLVVGGLVTELIKKLASAF